MLGTIVMLSLGSLMCIQFCCIAPSIPSPKPSLPTMCFEEGLHGMPKDHSMVIMWTSKAAEKGHAAAQFNLGEYLCQGKGVSMDSDVNWIEGLGPGFTYAQNAFGGIYIRGLGLPQNFVNGVELLTMAAEEKKCSVLPWLLLS